MDRIFRLLSTLVCLIATIHGFSVRQIGKSCTINGKTISDGSTFKLEAIAGNCVDFLCQNGEVMPGSYGCERDGKCFPEGDTYNLGCVQRRCGMVNGNFGYSRINEGCSIKDACLAVNETYQDGCFKYKCVKSGGPLSITYSLELIEFGCSSGGKCYKEGHVLEIQCRKMQCKNINGVAGFANIETGCPFGDTCIGVGKTKVDACRTYACRKTDINGIPYYAVDVVDVKCEDVNLDCHDPGTYFAFKMGGQVRQNCTCHTEGLNLQYFC